MVRRRGTCNGMRSNERGNPNPNPNGPKKVGKRNGRRILKLKKSRILQNICEVTHEYARAREAIL